jgi:hypothetical protein
MRRGQVALGICLVALAACGDDSGAPSSEEEARKQGTQAERTQFDVGPRGAELEGLCRRILRDTDVRMRFPRRRAGESFRSYERRVRHAVVEMGAQFRMLYLRLKDTPGTHDQRSFEPFQLFLSAVEATAHRFEAVAGYRNRNRVELRSALVFPAKQYLQLAQVAERMGAPTCAPEPGSAPLG